MGHFVYVVYVYVYVRTCSLTPLFVLSVVQSTFSCTVDLLFIPPVNPILP